MLKVSCVLVCAVYHLQSLTKYLTNLLCFCASLIRHKESGTVQDLRKLGNEKKISKLCGGTGQCPVSPSKNDYYQ